MNRVNVGSVEQVALGDGVTRRRLADTLGASELAVNRYTVDPGARLAGLHAHAGQEEVFVVLDGAAVFETLDGRVPVAAGEAIRFPPGEFQSCVGDDDGTVVLALGAPQDGDDVRIPVRCSACGHGEHRLRFPDGEERLVCPGCGAESAPACSECDGDALRVVLDGNGRPVERCRDCGATTPAQ